MEGMISENILFYSVALLDVHVVEGLCMGREDGWHLWLFSRSSTYIILSVQEIREVTIIVKPLCNASSL